MATKRWRKWPAGEGRGLGLGPEGNGDLGRRAAEDRRNEARSLLEAMADELMTGFRFRGERESERVILEKKKNARVCGTGL